MSEYFSHDYNARNDTKLVKVFMKYGLSGIGAFWCIIEMLYEEGGYLLRTEYERIAFELRTDNETISDIIESFSLFEFDNEKFWSSSALYRLKERMDKSEKARVSVSKRWDKYKKDTNVIQSNNDSNTRKEKEIKLKESKIPTFEEFKTYALENQPLINIESLKLKYDSWVVNNWKNGNGKKILNWKSNLLNTIPYIKLNAAIKETPKYEYLPREWKIENGYQVSRQYIKANNKDGFKALMTDEEKVKKGFDVNLIVTNKGEVL